MAKYDVAEIEGIGKAYAAKLKAAGIADTAALLARAATAKGRSELAEATGIPGKLVLGWANKADLMRVKGVGEEFSDLLEAAGVDTVKELAARNAENLHKALAATNAARKLVRQLPTQKTVEGWISAAKELPRVMTY
jgi:predicted flap endonuclease-1-like 5' DNA nuclease